MSTTKDLAEVFRREMASNPALAEAVEREALAANIATQIYDARTGAGLTQAQLAKLVGTQQSVIARMEDSDYNGHSLNMLNRIASAVGQRVYVEFRKRFTDEFIESRRGSGSAASVISWDKLLSPASYNPTFHTEITTSPASQFAQGI